ncbi:helix-turn-helix transcriptional regulator [Ulvibacterium sp.]|uniref:helix-turn-helix domain-containing protein n=1 Tax=Ulvibacterium sp. TaxID=2665914 RepID=UPI002625C2B3|nr:helix-turn-helix transcriptional regulator [Ulvibacterium sp.]
MRFSAIYGIVFGLWATVNLYAQADTLYLDNRSVQTKDDYGNLEIREWKKLKYFEAQLNTPTSTQEGTESEFRDYARDSIRILKVKLLAIQILDSKNLLDLDITENPDYYMQLLTKLKKSDINRSDYLFLENKLAFLTTEVVESKYKTSKLIIGFLGFTIIGLVLFFFWIRRERNGLPKVGLSRQERNIQGLILQGKSNKEIANELFISLSTVKTHITNIYSKLHVSSREELLQKIRN